MSELGNARDRISDTFSLRKPCDSFLGLLVGGLRASYFDRAV